VSLARSSSAVIFVSIGIGTLHLLEAKIPPALIHASKSLRWKRRPLPTLTLAGALIGDATAAEDIVTDTFIAVWREADRFEGRSVVATWIMSIARFKALSERRRRLFLVLVGRAQAPVWDISANHHIERKKPMPYVNHYSFHILDAEWGHITIKISGHPPFPAQIMLNGHEYVACQARKAGIAFTKQGNCFTDAGQSGEEVRDKGLKC
jgi:hypothetical protein